MEFKVEKGGFKVFAGNSPREEDLQVLKLTVL